MGLDMYLFAEKRFQPDDPQADEVCNAAGVTVAHLQHLTENPVYPDDAYIYLSRWGFQPESDEYALATAVHAAAGTLPFATDDTGSGALGWQDGHVFVRIACSYWRKANSIHKWFVENVQDGVDECQLSPEIAHEHLALLLGLCKQALLAYESDSVEGAAILMPPTSGFFFGNTEVNQWWAEDMKITIAQLDRVLDLASTTSGATHFYYQSSW